MEGDDAVIRMQDGHTTVDTSIDPDGRVRLTVTVAGEVVAAPSFAATDYSETTFIVNGAILSEADRKAGVR